MTAWEKSHLAAAKTQKADGVKEIKCPKRQGKRGKWGNQQPELHTPLPGAA